jgi:hypothetical protein
MSRHSVVIGSFVCPLGYCGSGVLGSCPRSRPTVTLRTPPDPETPAVEAVTGRTATSDAGRELNRAFTQLDKQLVPDALSVDVLAKQMGVLDSLVNDAHGRMPSTGCDDVSIVNHCTINFESRGFLGSILGPDLSLLESLPLPLLADVGDSPPPSGVMVVEITCSSAELPGAGAATAVVRSVASEPLLCEGATVETAVPDATILSESQIGSLFRADPMDWEAEFAAWSPVMAQSATDLDFRSPDLGRLGQGSAQCSLRAFIDASHLQGEGAGLGLDDVPTLGGGELLELEVAATHDGPNMTAVVLTPPRTSTAAIMQQTEDRVCIPMESPLIKVGPRLRRPRTPATVLSIRRSTRLAAKPRAANVTLQA